MTSPTIVQGIEVKDYPQISPEAERGRILRVTEVGEEILHRPLARVSEFGTDYIHQLVDDMFATMLVAEGVGLAANQVDVDMQLFVYDITTDDGVRHVGHVCNPEIDLLSDATEEMEEGCLSVPGPGADLFRARDIRITGSTMDGEPFEMEAHGYLARCFQHETGHLGGQLYIDLLSKRTRKRLIKDMKHLREEVLERRTELAGKLGKEAPSYPETPFV